MRVLLDIVIVLGCGVILIVALVSVLIELTLRTGLSARRRGCEPVIIGAEGGQAASQFSIHAAESFDGDELSSATIIS